MKTLTVTNSTRQKNFFLSNLSDAEIIENNDNFRDIVSRIGNENVILILPSSLSIESISSYGGINLALECYFHILNNNLLESSIIICGFENKGAFYDHCPLSDIVRCSGIQYACDAKAAVSLALKIPHKIEKRRALEELRMVRVAPPAAFKSHHTITNEWCIMRWSKYLGLKCNSLSAINSLYFRYLNTIYSPLQVNSFKKILIKSSGKILVIDDEINKGWDSFYNSLFSNYPDIDHKCIGEDFKGKSQDTIIAESIEIVKSFDPHVVLVDLRLHESDHDKKDAENAAQITGVRLISEIKGKINKGIQIIGVTASNKVWNYQKVKNLVDGYIIKESPEFSAESDYTSISVKSLLDSISHALEHKYLKSVYSDIITIENKFGKLELMDDEMFRQIITNLRMSFHLESTAQSNEQYAFAYIELFQIIEIINKYFYEITIPDGKLDSVFRRITMLYYNTWNQTDLSFKKEINDMIDVRGAFIHQNMEQLKTPPYSDIFSKTGYIQLFSRIKEICLLLADDYS